MWASTYCIVLRSWCYCIIETIIYLNKPVQVELLSKLLLQNISITFWPNRLDQIGSTQPYYDKTRNNIISKKNFKMLLRNGNLRTQFTHHDYRTYGIYFTQMLTLCSEGCNFLQPINEKLISSILINGFLPNLIKWRHIDMAAHNAKNNQKF